MPSRVGLFPRGVKNGAGPFGADETGSEPIEPPAKPAKAAAPDVAMVGEFVLSRAQHLRRWERRLNLSGGAE